MLKTNGKQQKKPNSKREENSNKKLRQSRMPRSLRDDFASC